MPMGLGTAPAGSCDVKEKDAVYSNRSGRKKNLIDVDGRIT